MIIRGCTIHQGRGNDFFVGGGHVDMPSDCQNLGGGGTGISIPLRQKVGGGGQLPPLAPGSRAPVLHASSA